MSILAALGGLAGALVVATPSQAAGSAAAAGAGSPVAVTGSAAPKLPAGAVRLGEVSPAAAISLDVTLKVPDQSALNAFVAGLSDRNSPFFHHFLGPGQFGPMFGPSLATVNAVESVLKSAGLSPGQVASDRLSIPVTATAAAIERAFGISLVSYRMPGGRVAYANSAAPRLPSAIEPLVQGVLGLNNLYPEQSAAAWPSVPVAPKPAAGATPFSHAVADTAGPQPCTAAKDLNADGTLTANQLAEHYLMSPLYSLGDLGKGVRVALYELEPNLTSDISKYESCYGIKTAVNYTKVDGGPGSGAGEGEAALDIEDVAGLAPDATLDVYQAPNNDTGAEDGWSTIINDDKDQVISSSWGECEDEADASAVVSMDTLFEQAYSQDQSVFAAIGDSGSTGCFGSGADPTDLSVWTPASSPGVMAVGGTTIGSSTETVWNESAIQDGAGGGGLSDIWCMPSYQYQTSIPGLINSASQTNSACSSSNAGSYIREVPDVSADADPQTGYAIFFNGEWEPIGGTSAATPLWAAVAALTDASPFCADYGSGHPGILSPVLYTLVADEHSYIYSNSVPEVLFDVTSGNNDYTPSGYTGGLYKAGKGFDEASGLGVPLVSGLNAAAEPSTFYPGLTALMCAGFATKLTSIKVTGVTPSAGPAGHATTVTVHGSGFLPIAGADMATVGSGQLTASCSSTTACKVTLPAKSAGTTVDIQITAEDIDQSAKSTADRYKYVAAPSLTSLSPTRGPAKGGTKVTIHGTNFIDVTAVHFGKKAGTHVTDVSATEVTVTAPAGSGTVHVTVTAAGGTTSSTSTASKYQYVAAPSVSSLSPAHGPAKGGNTVTIHGKNFIGVTAVHFGKKLATHLKVVSATEVTVTAPAGSGTVHVTVTATGGTSSSSSSASGYRYS